MAEQAYAYVTLIPVAKGFQSAVAKEMGGVGNIGKKAGADAGGKFKGSFGGAVKGLAALAGTALAGVGISKFFGDAVTKASDLGESLNAVSVAYGKASGDIAKLGEDAATRLGVTQTDFNAAAVRFSAFAERVVGEGGNVGGFVDDVTTRAADFASVFNIDVSEALQVFQSGLSGEAEPLKRFGINLLDSEVKAYALQEGLIGVGEQMSEDIKTQARYGLLMQETAKTAGDFANTSDGLANSQRILSANFDDMKAQIGNALLPAFANLSQSLLPVVSTLGEALKPAIENLTPAIEGIARQIPYLLESFIPLIPVIGELAGVFIELAAEGLSYFADLVAMLMPLISELVPLVLNLASEVLPVLFFVIEALLAVLAPIIEAILPVFAELLLALAPIVTELVMALLPLVLELLPILLGLIEFLIPVLEVAAMIFGELLIFAIELFVGAIENVSSVLTIFGSFFEGTFGGLGDFFYKIINSWIGAFESFVNFIIRGVNGIINAINRIQVSAPGWVTALTGMTSFGFNISRVSEISLPRIALAKGGLVTGPTNALVGEAGPEVVMPLDRFEKVMGLNQGGQPINYYAAPNKSFDAEQELLLAMRRVKVMA